GEPAPAVLDLGPAAELDGLTRAWRGALESGSSDEAGAALREAVWGRVLPLVEGCRGLVLAPDGEMYHLPLGAGPRAGGGVVRDRFEVRQVLSGRDLLRWATPPSWEGEPLRPALVVGDPEGADPVAPGPLLSRWWGRLRRAVGGRPGSR